MSGVVLLSGGMDSATLLFYVKKYLRYGEVMAVGFDYGQKHVKELEFAKELCKDLGVGFSLLKIDFNQFGLERLALFGGDVPSYEEERQEDTVVPGRNVVFLVMASVFAVTKGLKDVFYCPTLEDFRTYIDCRREFVDLISLALSKGVGVQGVYAPFVEKSKSEIIGIGLELGVPYDRTWSCYMGQKEPCMECDACRERMDAFGSWGLDYWGKKIKRKGVKNCQL